MTLTDFLLARIAEDELAAKRAASHVDWLRMCDWVAERSSPDVGLFILDHHPARVLSECEAKRQIVETHRGVHECPSARGIIAFDTDMPIADGSYGGPCDTLMGLALPYVDHPDYREEWKP